MPTSTGMMGVNIEVSITSSVGLGETVANVVSPIKAILDELLPHLLVKIMTTKNSTPNPSHIQFCFSQLIIY